MTCLFVGGPADGEIRDVQEDYQSMVHSDGADLEMPRVTKHTYTLRRFAVIGDARIPEKSEYGGLNLLVWDELSNSEVAQMLLQGYQAMKQKDEYGGWVK